MSVTKVVARAAELGYATVALVDTMGVSGMPDLCSLAKKAGIKPITGCTLKVYADSKWRKPKAGSPGATKNPFYTLKVYVHDADGLRQLYALLSLANDPEHFYYNARVSLDEVLFNLSAPHVSISTGDLGGVMHDPGYFELCDRIATHFGKLWVEVVPMNTPLYDTLNLRAQHVSSRLGYSIAPPLLTYPALYPEGAADSADVLRAITSNNKMTDPWLNIPFVRDMELASPNKVIEQARAILTRGDVPAEFVKEAIRNMGVFAAQDFFVFEKREPCLPVMAPDEFAALVQQCREGWAERLMQTVLGFQPAAPDLEAVYKPRLVYELGVIRKMGFSGYFLLVQEIVRWSKANGVMVGPGRGSVGGSLIAYLMGITDVDPIRFNLLFERFINPSRVDLPDADLDFMSTRRQEVIEHIEGVYGAENVAGISNYSTLGPASAMRDCSRVHGLDPLDYAASKQTEKEHGTNIPLLESAERVPDIAKFRDSFPKVWGHAVALEGAMRSLGKHAAGVVVAGEPVVNRAVVETRSGGQVVNWDKRTVEDHGLIKIDILGLSTLDTLHLCAQYIWERHHKRVDFLKLPLDDDEVLRAFGRGETVGVFQYESFGMRKLLMQLQEGGDITFEDLVAVTALFRPGPLDAGMCDEYVQIKQGVKTPTYEHDHLKAALEPTFGVIIYQEQVMQVCRDVAGFNMVEADNVRKAMGKKDAAKMAGYKDLFIAGAATVSGMNDYQAGNLWDKLAGFASYGFNRSHAVEYAVISWWTMWCKVRYPAEFFAASMSVVDKDDKLSTLMMDAKRAKIDVLPPDINLSTHRIEIKGERELIAPFQAVKGISDNSARAIIELRAIAGGKIDNLAQLEALATANKMGGKCNKTHRERLVRVGALHSVEGGLPPLHPDRLKDRLELMPGFTVDTVKADRVVVNDSFVMTKLIRLVEETKSCDQCSLKGGVHVAPRMGKTPKFVMVFDSPSWQEERAGKMLEGDSADYLKAALKDAGLSPNDGYYTALVKSVRTKGSKGLTTEQVNGCSGFLDQEIETLKPPVIVLMGSASIKHFAPSLKANPSDLIGKVVFDPKRDASILFGLNPAQVIFDMSKVAQLELVAQKLVDLIN